MHLCAVHRGLQPKEKQQKKKKESRLFQSTTYLCDLILQWDCTEVKNSEWEGNAFLICKFYLLSNSNQLKKISIMRRPCERNCATYTLWETFQNRARQVRQHQLCTRAQIKLVN